MQEWQQSEYAPNLAGCGPLCVTNGRECHMLVEREGLVHRGRVDELCTSQEGADSRILLHANHAAKEGNTV